MDVDARLQAMDPVVAGILGGTAAGAVITGLFNAWRILREERRHFVDVKRERYAEYLRLADEVDSAMLEYLDELDKDPRKRLSVDIVSKDLTFRTSEIALLSEEVGRAASTLFDALLRATVTSFVAKPGEPTLTFTNRMARLSSIVNGPRAAFIRAARADLGTSASALGRLRSYLSR
jgi:hypothetical protein